MKKQCIGSPLQLVGPVTLVVVLTGLASSIHAATYDLGDGRSLHWGNIMRYNLGVRAESPDRALRTNLGTDESTSAYGRGDIVNNRLDWYTELAYDHQGRYGFVLSAAAWYNDAFNRRVRTGPGLSAEGSYDNNRFSDQARKYHGGPYGEILDAYLYSNFSLGTMYGDLKVGRQTNLWGEAIALTTHSVSHVQAPVDGLKAAASPGADAREVSMPVGQVHMNLQVNERLSLSAQYFFEWEHTRLSEGGTFLAGSDILLTGPDRFALAPGVFLRNEGIDKPSGLDDFGLALRYASSALNAEFGFYYRVFDERSPTVSMDLANGTYRFIYPENTRLYGVSMAKRVGSVSVGTEVVYRDGTALLSSITDGDDQGARGNTWHFLANAVKNFGPNRFWSSASLTTELGFSHLDKVTRGKQYFNGCQGGRDERYGCATRNNWVGSVRFSPTWVGISPGWDASFNMAVTYGLYGNSAVSGGGNEKAGNYSIGPSLTYNAAHVFSLSYIDYLATHKANPAGGLLYSNGSQMQDRGWVSLSYSGTF